MTDKSIRNNKKHTWLCMTMMVMIVFLSLWDIRYPLHDLTVDAGQYGLAEESLSVQSGKPMPETTSGSLLEADRGVLPDYLGEQEKTAVCNMAWLCRSIAKRTTVHRLDFTFYIVICMYALCIGFAVFLFYSTRTANRSLKFIICYIHDKDGQKD